MHSIKGGLFGQTYALAASNDSGGRKSRIRRSKEERKAMVESFVKKFQKSNEGKFPSLNLTHKEVGGSFYSVREIFREIIQENRVLAPPKEEDNHFEFLEQHPLVSISVEPGINLSSSHGDASIKHQFQGKNISSSTIVEEDQPKEIIKVNEVLQENAGSYNVENNGNDLEFSHVPSETGKQKLLDEQHINQGHTVDITEEFGQRISESEAKHIVHMDASRANDVDPSKVVESHADSNALVETFPLRLVPKTFTGIDGESGHVQETTLKEDVKHVSGQTSSDFGNKNDEKMQGNNILMNTREPSLESAKRLSYSKGVAVNVSSIISDHSNDVVTSKDVKDTSTLAEQSSPTLNRVRLETWKGGSKKPTESETNPLLAFVKALVTAFVKLWT